MHQDILGVSLLRWALAAAGLVAGLVAVIGAVLNSDAAGWCLRQGEAGFGHCGWCYLGVGLLLTAAAPWPQLRKARVRPRG
ncbi:hypothetical protein [Caulobacter sp. 17J80-11]|uniref:hypothetical protein n=1 Tax=Caulobacter sp. 17J80-11 TaxID=2763502 RepID=UPI0016537ADB|nr:hypothetical protein [Caulobacter sp. 17J80-11]MBC6983764.1 hypothetical protein [Caulobacter sp. 17J80-11]